VTPPVQNYRIEVDHPVTVAGADGRSFAVNLDPHRPDYVTTDGVEVWMERKKIRTRFLDAAGAQVGPWHKNLVPAIVWAAAAGWTDPSVPAWWSAAVTAEVRANSTSRRRKRKKPEDGAWDPNPLAGRVVTVEVKGDVL